MQVALNGELKVDLDLVLLKLAIEHVSTILVLHSWIELDRIRQLYGVTIRLPCQGSNPRCVIK